MRLMNFIRRIRESGRFKKRKNIIAAVFLLAVLFWGCPVPARADDDWCGISQIVQDGKKVNLYISLPEGMDVRDAGLLATSTFTVWVNGETELVPQEAAVFSALDEGTCYVFAVDISKSLTEDEMQQIQSAMTSFVDALGSDDRMQIITAGEGAEALLNKPVSNKTKLKEAVAQSVQRTADYTYLYQAIYDALETRSRSADTLPERMAVVVITDGKDTSDGGVSSEGLKEELLEERIPLYVIGVKGSDSSASLEEVRTLAELSGGCVISDAASDGSASISDALEAVRDLVKESIRLTVQPTEDTFALEECSWTVSCSSGTDTFASASYWYPLSLEEALAAIETESETETETQMGLAVWESAAGEAGTDTQSGAGTGFGTEADSGDLSENAAEGGNESGMEAGSETLSEGSAEAGTGSGAEGSIEAGTGTGAEGSIEAGTNSESGSDAAVSGDAVPENTAESSASVVGEELQENVGVSRFARGGRITCIAAVLIGISIVLILASLILWKKCRDLDDPEPQIEPPCEDGYETLTNPGFPEDEETADFPDAFDDEETVDEIEGMGVRLRFEITFDGHTEVTEHILREQLVLGRGTECDVDVVLQSASPERKRISRHHAYIVNHADGLFVRDNAKNKTWINGVEVAGECALRDGDILRMAGATVKVGIL